MGKKVVCHITDVHPRDDVRIFYKECKSLAENGYEVYLIVCDDKPSEEIDGVHIVSTEFKPTSRKERFIKGPRAVLKKALEIDADIFQVHDPELLTIVKALKKTGKKVIFDSHEDVEKQLYDAYYIPKIFRGIVSKLYVLYASGKYREIDGIISVSPQIVEKFKKWNDKVQMVTNYPILESFSEEDADEGRCPYIFFAGGVSEQWMHENIIEAVSKIDNLEYVIAGSASEVYLEKLKKTNGWDKTRYLGKINRAEVAGLYKKCLAGVSINYSSQIKGIGTLGNNKLFEIMSAGKPVICTDYSLWQEIIEEYKCGICINPFDVNEIEEAILFLVNNSSKAKEMGKNGRKAVEEKYNWKTQERELIDFYNMILS